jgi:tRNA(Ile)-lysidine synthase TilS/MesJ
MTFDNGYIPRGCFDNIERVCQELGVTSTVVRLHKSDMDAVFSESLRNDATVCGGCFRALTARSTEMAIAEGIPVIVTGLSRGQIADTKVDPLIQSGITKAADIDRHLKTFREFYHRSRDRIADLIDDRALADERAFANTVFVDFYRYCPATKAEIVSYLQAHAPFWAKPQHVGGCSSNCMVNDVGIQVHLQTRGYHNYARPLAWDVRFGHITRDAALSELSAEVDTRKTHRILRSIQHL